MSKIWVLVYEYILCVPYCAPLYHGPWFVCVCVPVSKLQTGFQWEVTTPFQLSPDRGVLGPGQECRVTVVFRPLEALVYQREASCAFGDDGETTCTVLLQGMCEWQLCGVLLSVTHCIRNRNVNKYILMLHATHALTSSAYLVDSGDLHGLVNIC